MDIDKLQRAVRLLLEAVGEDPDRPGLRDTPRRVAEMYAEVFSGLGRDPGAELLTHLDERHDEMVLVRDIAFFSVCEHHLLPFFGSAHVAYIPQGRLTGLSKLARVVDVLARRPQTQERLTSTIADVLWDGLKPKAVAVVTEAEHLCMSMRGVNKPGTLAVTSAMRGLFRTNPASRAEVLALMRKPK